MASPRELAEQAFAILQNALRDSEARAADLDDQLKRKKAPKSKVEEQLDVLQHRLDAVEAERARWEHAASHLEEIAEAERAKVAALKKKLEVAESGPEKLTKKEINFWRAKAEEIDTETKDYKTRLASLRRELMERDALIEKLGQAQPSAAAPAGQDASPVRGGEQPDVSAELEQLHAQLEQRERRINELQVELNEARETDQSAPPSTEIQAQIETLTRQVATFDKALTEALAARTTLKAELAHARAEINERDRAARELQTLADRARATLADREHKLVELSAEIEQVRAEQRQREQQLRDSGTQRDGEIKALARDLDSLRQRAENDRRDVGQVQAERDHLREALRAAQQRLDDLNRELEQLSTVSATAKERSEQDVAAAMQALKSAAAERDSLVAERNERLGERDRLIAERDEQLVERNRMLAERTGQLEERDRLLAERTTQLGERDRLLAERTAQLGERDRLLAERDWHLGERDGLIAQHDRLIAQRDEQLAQRDHELKNRQQQEWAHGELLADRDRRLTALSAELEQARTTVQATDRELTSLRNTLLGSNRDLDQLRNQKQRLEAELSETIARADALSAIALQKDEELRELHEQRAVLESQRTDAREQLAGLETELKDEKVNAENLVELANERREAMTKLKEQAEEAEERFAEAKWRLGKAQHFERLVKRRKGLVKALLGALRAKAKSNVALKAGLDGLRTYKAAAEVNQQKLLQRIDALKIEIKEAEEAIERQHGSTLARQELTDAISKAAALEERLDTQAELIQSLEADLKAARVTQRSGDEKNQEIEHLQTALEAKTALVTELQAEVDEQQRKLGKLRGSESETVRLKAMTEKDRSAIDALEREVAQLREALARQNAADPAASNGAVSTSNPDLEAKLKERETSLNRLMGTIKEHEATIKKLTESAESWKRKYNFLASDAPEAYKTAVEK